MWVLYKRASAAVSLNFCKLSHLSGCKGYADILSLIWTGIINRKLLQNYPKGFWLEMAKVVLNTYQIWLFTIFPARIFTVWVLHVTYFVVPLNTNYLIPKIWEATHSTISLSSYGSSFLTTIKLHPSLLTLHGFRNHSSTVIKGP